MSFKEQKGRSYYLDELPSIFDTILELSLISGLQSEYLNIVFSM